MTVSFEHPTVEKPERMCPKCGHLCDTFACKIRHLEMNTGDAKAAQG